MNFSILNDEGKIINCNVIGIFKHEDKDFVVYTDESTDNEEIFASLYKLDDDDNIKLLPITDDKDWDLVDNYLEELWKIMLNLN